MPARVHCRADVDRKASTGQHGDESADNSRRRHTATDMTQYNSTTLFNATSTASAPATITSSGRLVLSVHVAAGNRAFSDRRG